MIPAPAGSAEFDITSTPDGCDIEIDWAFSGDTLSVVSVAVGAHDYGQEEELRSVGKKGACLKRADQYQSGVGESSCAISTVRTLCQRSVKSDMTDE